MHGNVSFTPKRMPWNKGELIGAKPPLRPKHVWPIRTKLQIDHQLRDLALFNLAIDSTLRGCDVVAIKGEFLFSGRRPGRSMTTRQYARLLSDWLVSVDLDPHVYGTHYGGQKRPSFTVGPAIFVRAATARAYQDREHG
jgi:hypothetical protein